MLKRIFIRTRTAAAALMVVSLLVPVQIAQASGTITKEITVLGPDGNPYEGALVGMYFQPQAGSFQKIGAITPVLTDSAGKATFTFSDSLRRGNIIVQPPVSDTSTAVALDGSTDHANNSPHTVNLENSVFRINLLASDNQPTPPYSLVSTEWLDWAFLIRGGIANINVSQSVPTDSCKTFYTWAHDAANGSHRRFYGIKVTGTGNSRTATLYNDTDTCLNEVSKVNGVYQLKFNQADISGNILSNSGQALTFAANQGYDVEMNPVDSNGSRIAGLLSTFSHARSDGSWDSFVDTSTAGRYELTFRGYGNPDYPTFDRKYFWVTTDGRLSWNADGSNPVSNLSGNFNIPIPNIKLNFIDTATTQNIRAIVSISKKISGGSIYGEPVYWEYLDGRPSFKLEDGDYRIELMADYGSTSITLSYSVSEGNATLTSSSLPTYALASGTYTVWLPNSNALLSVQNLTGNSITNGWLELCSNIGGGELGSCRGYGFGDQGQLNLSIADGSWIIVVRPGGETGMSSKRYAVSVTSGVVTITGASQSNNRWILTGTAPNISGSFTLSSGSLSFTTGGGISQQGISLSVQKNNDGNWEWQEGGTWLRSQNYVLNVTGEGRYRIVASPQNFTDLVQSYSNEFWINSSGQISTSEAGTYSESLTAFNILLKAPNLKMKVVNPLDNSLLANGWVTIEKVTGQSRSWVGNADISTGNPGLAGTNITEIGTYLLTVNPPNGSRAIVGLATRQYQLTVDANDSMTVTSGGVPVAIDGGRFVLAPATANVTARIVKANGVAFGNTDGKWVNVNLQKFQAERNFWEYSNGWASADQDGYISMRVDAEGKYRLRIEPNGDADATVTYSQEFTVASNELDTFKKEFGSITLRGPSIRVSVATTTNSSTPLNFANIEIRKDGNWLDWVNTNRTGIAGISLSAAGAYEFIVHPSNNLQGSASRKSYKITATADSEGVITATAVAGTGVSVANGVTTLLLGTPTLAGRVLAPSPSTTALANSQVVAADASTGQEMWEYSTNTNSSGAWSMSLPAGTYKIYAKTPWGTSTYGSSDGVGDVVVDASGNATSVPAGQSANTFNIRLKAPTWSGLVKNPAGTAVITGARVCLLLSDKWNCTNTDSNGAWALSAPSGFTNFTGTNPIIEIADDFGRQYPSKRIEGTSAVNTAIGTSGSNIVLQFANANTQIRVTAGGNAVPNVWVSAERDGSGWLGGGSTDSNGVAKLNIASPSSEFRVRIELNGNQLISSSYAATMKTFTAGDITAGTSGGVFSGTVALAEPNFKVVLREPTSDGSVGAALPNAWIELYSDTTGKWLGGAGTDASGFASFKLDAPSSGINNYTVTVNPAWNASTNFSRQAYAVAVSSSGLTVINKTSTAAVNLQDVSGRNVYPLVLGTPSVTGVVVNPAGGTVANSWVVPRDAITYEHYWQQGVNSRRNGEIAINLINGQYTLEANVPWGTSNLAKSASCAVTVSGGKISTGGACVQDGATKTVRLALRAPNVTFTLKIGGNPVANANVGIGSGSWYTNAQSDAEGKVSLFIDAPAIRAANNYTSAQPLYVWVDPPYGGSVEMARWDCSSTQSKPICSGLDNVPATGDYPTKTLGDVTGVSPNTRIEVVAPGTSTALPNSWVTVFAFDPANANNGRRWLGGGNSNSSGIASMNLETSTVPSSWKYAVEINAPWNQRQLYATNLDTNSGSGYSWAQLIGGLQKSPKLPNLTLTVNASNAVANKFGWIGVEEINSSDIYQSWVGGYGLNESGISSVFLAASKRYRITSYPGPGRSGARTTCIVTTNSSEVVAAVTNKCDAGTFTTGAVTIALDGGNVVGLVTKSSDGSPLVGAIVYANNPNAVDESTAVITTTGADGRYGLQLDPTKTWNIKVFPTGAGSEALGIGTLTGVTPLSSGSITRNFQIATR